jgi:hypothetical protein
MPGARSCARSTTDLWIALQGKAWVTPRHEERKPMAALVDNAAVSGKAADGSSGPARADLSATEGGEPFPVSRVPPSPVSPFGGGWPRQLYGDGGLDLLPIGNPVAQLVEALADFVPNVYALVSGSSTAFGEADKVGDVPLPGLAIDADGLD